MHRALLDLILTLIRQGHPIDAIEAPLADLCALADGPKVGRRARAKAAKVLTTLTEAIAKAP